MLRGACLASRSLTRGVRSMFTAESFRQPTTSASLVEPRTIELNAQEARVLGLIDDVTKHLRQTRSDLPAIECRVAGGWVRDKLLGKQCEDLDICTSSVTGFQFAELVEAYLQTHRPDSNGVDAVNAEDEAALKTSRIAKIVANPEQSKHLETARMTLLGMEIDFVQLRSEEYAECGTHKDSRIPTAIKFGTPLEDAQRRDFTINALFYNIHTRKVEDHLNKGLHDLLSKSPCIRTPLHPFQTFLDDPLRILRCIRFASRFNFPIDAMIPAAVLEMQVRSAFANKVSRERVGIELDKMLKGNNPIAALGLIQWLRIYDLIFNPPANVIAQLGSMPKQAAELAVKSVETLKWLMQHDSLPAEIYGLLANLDSPVARKRLWLSLALAPYCGITYKEKAKVLPVTDAIIRDSVKLPNADRLYVQRIHASSSKLSRPGLVHIQISGPESERSRIGMFLRDINVQDPLCDLTWQESMLFALVCNLTPLRESDPSTNEEDINSIIQLHAAFVRRVYELGLDISAYADPLLDGKEVIKLLTIPPGQLLQVLLKFVIEWQLDHPDASKDECSTALKNAWEAGKFAAARLDLEEQSAKKRRK